MGRSSSFPPMFLAAIVGPLVLFAILAIQVSGGSVPGWDESLMRFLHGLGELPVPTGTKRMVDNSATIGAIVLVGLVLALLVWRRLSDALFLTTALVGVVLLEPLLKNTFERQPPGDSDGFSFPSGSAMASMTIVAALSFLAWATRLRWLVVLGGTVVVLAFGAAIVDLGWHYPSDVLAGWCIALAWVSGVWLIVRRRATILDLLRSRGSALVGTLAVLALVITISGAGASTPPVFSAEARSTALNSAYADQVIADGPISYWRLGDTSGTTASDVAGANPGTYTGGVTLGQQGALTGDPDSAASFDGVNDYVLVPDSSSLDLTAGVTVEAWVKRNRSGVWQVLLGKPGTGQSKYENYALWFNTQNQVVAYFGDGVSYVSVVSRWIRTGITSQPPTTTPRRSSSSTEHWPPRRPRRST